MFWLVCDSVSQTSAMERLLPEKAGPKAEDGGQRKEMLPKRLAPRIADAAYDGSPPLEDASAS
jgi:hypothetical protein